MRFKLNKIIAFIQIVGGIYGLIMTINGLFGGPGSLMFWTVNILSFIFFMLTIVAGFLLWSNAQIGVVLSILVQMIQVPQFHIKGYYYYIFAGLELSARYMFLNNLSNIRFENSAGSSFRLSCNTANENAFVFGFNLLALLLLIYLLVHLINQRKRLKGSALDRLLKNSSQS